MRGIYRHSVWIDVFGVVLIGLVLLGGAGYLLFNLGGSASGLGGEGGRAIGAAGTSPQGGGPSLSARPSSPAPSPGPAFGDAAPVRNESGAAVPFSDGWQKRAAPDLAGALDGSAPPPSGGGMAAVGGGPPGTSGPTVASGRPAGGLGGVGDLGGGGSSASQSGWQAEARRLSSRARALAGQLRQLGRSGKRDNQSAARPEQSSAKASATGGEATTSNDPGTPTDPSQVPIGDHLHWLAALGVLWGVWRLWRGA